MAFEDLKSFPVPQKIIVKDIDGDTRVPYERIKSYDDNEYELFIREWVVSLNDRFQVRGFGGAGDKGRDVVAKDAQGKFYYYQCKHYDHPLTPSDVYSEFGKLVYYTFVGEIPLPCEYYLLASQDIGVKLSDLIDNPQKINKALLDNWQTHCQTRICSTPIPLTSELKKYIEDFDFGIIKTKTMMEVVAEHKKTAFHAFRFGGGLTVNRNRPISVPQSTQEIETNYIKKILLAIAEKERKESLSLSEVEESFPQYLASIKMQRERFFSAENLKLFTKEHLLTDEYFIDLCNDIFDSIYDYTEQTFSDGYERMSTVLSEVAKVDLHHNLLVKYDLVNPRDRQGVCHHLANEREDFVWTNKK